MCVNKTETETETETDGETTKNIEDQQFHGILCQILRDCNFTCSTGGSERG